MSGLFRRNLEKRCAYCVHGVTVSETQVACKKRGVVDASGHCFRYAYDPLRRVPPRPAELKTEGFKPEDFSLN